MLNRYFVKIGSWVAAFQRLRYWRFYLVFICFLFCILSNTPAYTLFTTCKGTINPVWATVNNQADHPFTPIRGFDSTRHEAKMTFRLVAPMMVRLLPVTGSCSRMTCIFILQNIAGLFFLYILIRLTEKNTGDKLLALLIPVSFCVLYTGSCFFCDMNFFFDSFAFLFLLIAVSSRRFPVIFCSMLLAYFTDERSLIASGFVALYHLLADTGTNGVVSSNPKRLAVTASFAAMPVYLAVRCYLQFHFGLHTPIGKGADVSPTEILSKIPLGGILLGVFIAFKSFWLILFLGIFYIKGRTGRILFGGTLLSILGASISVYDFSRSVSYAFIGLLVVIFEMSKKENRSPGLKKMILLLFVTSMLNPVFAVRGPATDINQPVFVKLLNRLFKD